MEKLKDNLKQKYPIGLHIKELNSFKSYIL